MNGSLSGAAIGLVLACSVVLVVSRLRATAPLTLRERITPFVPDLRAAELTKAPSALETIRALLPAARTGGRDDRPSAGQPIERLAAIAGGVGFGALLGFALALRGSSGLLVILLAAVGGLAGQLTHSALQTGARHRRSRRIGAELPDLAELLAFAVAAGESPTAAIARVGAMSGGDLGVLMRRAIAETRLGTSFETAMRDLVDASDCPDVERFVDSVLLAMERGTPLAEFLRAQAADSRASQSRRLMESAGRKDVAMLIPVVFLILPTVVLIALFPGFRSLHLFIN
ncbi:MAG: type II secretion system F family protein [Candidatus Nanopelagicales bacterium]